MRSRTIALSSVGLVLVAAGAVAQSAFAQDVPVTYRTDPGPAHPRYSASSDLQPLPPSPSLSPVSSNAGQPQIAGSRIVGQAAYAVPVSDNRADPLYGMGQGRTITVSPGDSVYALGRRYGVDPKSIISANRMSYPYQLAIGQQIFLPSVAAAPQVTPYSPARRDVAAVPVAERRLGSQNMYRVQQGDTLYSLSRRYQVSVSQIASANNLYAPFDLKINQTLIIPSAGMVAAAPTQPRIAAPTARDTLRTSPRNTQAVLVSKNPSSRFAWPLRGSIVERFGTVDGGIRNDGINIAAPVGALVRATADGEVVYTGAALEGYGNLLLIRHNDGWVSAYAHTDAIMVKKGDRVQQGQVVAKVGASGKVQQPQLHFELRHQLKPRDPMAALTGQDELARASL